MVLLVCLCGEASAAVVVVRWECGKRSSAQTRWGMNTGRLRARGAHQTAGACTEFQNELTPELTPRLGVGNAPRAVNVVMRILRQPRRPLGTKTENALLALIPHV